MATTWWRYAVSRDLKLDRERSFSSVFSFLMKWDAMIRVCEGASSVHPDHHKRRGRDTPPRSFLGEVGHDRWSSVTYFRHSSEADFLQNKNRCNRTSRRITKAVTIAIRIAVWWPDNLLHLSFGGEVIARDIFVLHLVEFSKIPVLVAALLPRQQVVSNAKHDNAYHVTDLWVTLHWTGGRRRIFTDPCSSVSALRWN